MWSNLSDWKSQNDNIISGAANNKKKNKKKCLNREPNLERFTREWKMNEYDHTLSVTYYDAIGNPIRMMFSIVTRIACCGDAVDNTHTRSNTAIWRWFIRLWAEHWFWIHSISKNGCRLAMASPLSTFHLFQHSGPIFFFFVFDAIQSVTRKANCTTPIWGWRSKFETILIAGNCFEIFSQQRWNWYGLKLFVTVEDVKRGKFVTWPNAVSKSQTPKFVHWISGHVCRRLRYSQSHILHMCE